MVCCICTEIFGKRRRAVIKHLSQERLLACKTEENNGSSDSKHSKDIDIFCQLAASDLRVLERIHLMQALGISSMETVPMIWMVGRRDMQTKLNWLNFM